MSDRDSTRWTNRDIQMMLLGGLLTFLGLGVVAMISAFIRWL
jgi:hypothetical protein